MFGATEARSLLDETGELTYASLATGADEGSYSTTLSWSAINGVLPIEFVDEEVRTFRARIFDQSGALAEATARVTLHCGGDAACAGACVDLQANADNCGACGRACPGGSVCEAGRCQQKLCVFVIGAGSDSCDAACAGAKLACQPCSDTSAAVGRAYTSGACTYYSDNPPPCPSPRAPRPSPAPTRRARPAAAPRRRDSPSPAAGRP